MKYRVTIISLVLAVFLSSGSRTIAQPAEFPGFLGFSFLAGNPQDDFKKNMENSGFGFSVILAYYPGHFALGFEFDYIYLGGNYFDYSYESIETVNSMTPLNLFVRVQPDMGFFMPYAEASAGLSFMQSSYEYKDSFYDDHYEDTEYGIAFNYGGAAGVMFKIIEFETAGRNTSGKSSLLLDFRVKYMKGSDAEYYITHLASDGTIDRGLYKSETDFVAVTVGIAFGF